MNQKGFAGFAVIILIVVLLFAAFVYVIVVSDKLSNKKGLVISASPKPQETAVSQPPDEYKDFFLSSIPKPINDLSIYKLPNNMSPRNVVQLADSLWFAGDGSVIEYDIKSGKLVYYSDATKANCTGNIVQVNGYLYVSCYVDNVDDAFGHTTMLQTPIFTGHYAIFKINPATHKVEQVFSKKEGLLNGYNYKLYADKDSIWVATFQGVGRINLSNNKVDFYQSELGIQGGAAKTNYGINSLFVDDKYVWAVVSSNVGSVGGITLFDKNTEKWKPFTSKELKDYEPSDTFNLDTPIKPITGGIQIGFRDGDIGNYERLVEKQYNYQTGKWTKISEQPLTGIYYQKVKEYIDSAYPRDFDFQVIDKFGLTQIKMPDSNSVYQLDGRNNYILSPLKGDKRYILTSATIDVIDDSSQFRQILVKLGSRLEDGLSSSDPAIFEGLVQFLVDQDGNWAIVTDSDCGGMGCTGRQKVWLVDLRAGKINATYQGEADGVPDGGFLNSLSLSKEGNILIVKDKEGKQLFNINTENNKLTQ